MAVLEVGCLIVRSPYTLPFIAVAEGYTLILGAVLTQRGHKKQGSAILERFPIAWVEMIG